MVTVKHLPTPRSSLQPQALNLLHKDEIKLKKSWWIGSWLVIMSMTLHLVMAPASAQALPKPKGPVILTVSGHISQRNAGDSAEFDAGMLTALAASQIVTKTPWQAPAARFSGPALKSLLSTVGAKGKVLRLIALDKYEVNIPIEDVASYGPVLALRMDDKELKIRNRGPVLLMYPFDSYPELDTEVYYGRSVWQLQHIVVE